MLAKLGYRVLAADTPKKALRLSKEHTGRIHLLITDVIMPEMNGRVLADQLRTLHPDIKTLFMSGYTASLIAHHGVLDKGVNFIQKPFTTRIIATKVREVLAIP
jgi:response regulator RpfG family c-di-GMP phosphodiesterase